MAFIWGHTDLHCCGVLVSNICLDYRSENPGVLFFDRAAAWEPEKLGLDPVVSLSCCVIVKGHFLLLSCA